MQIPPTFKCLVSLNATEIIGCLLVWEAVAQCVKCYHWYHSLQNKAWHFRHEYGNKHTKLLYVCCVILVMWLDSSNQSAWLLLRARCLVGARVSITTIMTWPVRHVKCAPRNVDKTVSNFLKKIWCHTETFIKTPAFTIGAIAKRKSLSWF